MGAWPSGIATLKSERARRAFRGSPPSRYSANTTNSTATDTRAFSIDAPPPPSLHHRFHQSTTELSVSERLRCCTQSSALHSTKKNTHKFQSKENESVTTVLSAISRFKRFSFVSHIRLFFPMQL